MFKRDGFTLIEILVALAILGIGLTLLLELFGGGLRSVKISEEYTQAVWHGKTKMEELMTAAGFTEGMTEGKFDDQFSWQSEVKKANPSLGLVGLDGTTEVDLPIDLYQIVLRVTWASGAGQRHLELESLRAYKIEESKE